MRTLWPIVLAAVLAGIGLIVTIVGVASHHPYSRSSPSFSRYGGYYTSAGGDATAIIAAGVFILLIGVGLGIVGLVVRSRAQRRG